MATGLEERLFITKEEVAELTDRRTKLAQIAHLRKLGILFYVNASGWPVVPREAVLGIKQKSEPATKWSPNGFNNGQKTFG